jgi:hypothetical protein
MFWRDEVVVFSLPLGDEAEECVLGFTSFEKKFGAMV